MGRDEKVYVTATCTDGTARNSIGELEVQEGRHWRVQLNVVLPELAVTANQTPHGLAVDVDGRVVALNANGLPEELTETEHASLPYARTKQQTKRGN